MQILEAGDRRDVALKHNRPIRWEDVGQGRGSKRAPDSSRHADTRRNWSRNAGRGHIWTSEKVSKAIKGVAQIVLCSPHLLWRYDEIKDQKYLYEIFYCRFDPDRFSSGPHSYGACFSPFGLGPRRCPGFNFAYHELYAAVAAILPRFKILPVNKNGEEEVGRIYGLVTKPDREIWITLEKRKPAQ